MDKTIFKPEDVGQDESALIGNPVSQSCSDVLFPALAQMNWFTHTHRKVPVESLCSLWSSLQAIQHFGASWVNVTLPYKIDVFNFVDHISPEARAIGAINSIVFNPDWSRTGYNTDAYWAICAATSLVDITQDSVILILWSGGAARAICYEMHKRTKHIMVAVRERNSEVERFSDDFINVEILCESDLDRLRWVQMNGSMIINTTSVWMKWKTPWTPFDIVRRLQSAWADISTLYCMDAVFNPDQTPFIKGISQNWWKTVWGLDWMIFQGIRALWQWRNKNVRLDSHQFWEIKTKLLSHVS